jgi:hypothetical protein
MVSGMSDGQIKVSELMALLSDVLEKRGDLPVVIQDADTGWIWKMKPSHVEAGQSRLIIGGCYGDEKDNE